jgi:O-antigen ligase
MGRERALVWAAAALAVAAMVLVGGAPTRVQLGLSAAALLLGIAFVLVKGRPRLQRIPFVAAAAVALGYTLFQLVPLPAALVRLVSPLAHEIRGDALGAPAWMPITLDVPATVLEVVKGVAVAGVFVVVASLSGSRRRAQRTLMVLAFAGGVLAALAIAQRFLGAGTILGLYTPSQPTGQGVFGTFVNGNHAASVFTISVLVSAGLANELRGGWRGVCVVVALVAFAGLLVTTSRGGAVGLFAGGILFASVLFARRFGAARGFAAALVLAAVVSAGSLWAADGLRARLWPAESSHLWANSKVRGWRDAARGMLAYRLTGVGRGAFEAPVAAFREHDEGVRLAHPENVLLQMGTEWGIPVSLAILAMLAVSTVRLVRQARRLEPGTLAAGCAVVAIAVHELTDFGLELLGVALPVAVLLGVVVARVFHPGEERRHEEPPPRSPRWVVAALLAGWCVALAGGVWAARHTIDADAAALATVAKQATPEARREIAAAIARHPASDHFALLSAVQALASRDAEWSRTALGQINRALRLHPANGMAHRLAARTLARLGRRSQAALEYRLAVERGAGVTLDEVVKVAGEQVLDAVPQRVPDLIALAQFLALRKDAKMADAAALRAVELAGSDEATRRTRLQIALLGTDKARIVEAANGLIEGDRPSVLAYVAAGDALAQAGEAARADQVIAAGIAAHEDAGPLVTLGGRQRLVRNELTAARAFVRLHGARVRTLADRKANEELLAEIADKAGEPDEAVLARARARLLARQIRDSVSAGHP